MRIENLAFLLAAVAAACSGGGTSTSSTTTGGSGGSSSHSSTTVTVTTTSGETPYVRYGEWIIWTSGILLAGAVVLSIRREGLTPRKRADRAGFLDSPAPSDRPAESPGETA